MRALDGLPLVLLYVVVVVPSVLVLWVGLRLGARSRESERKEPEAPLGSIVGALLALLAFLLGFSFNTGAGRLETRRQLVIAEADAIITAYLRAQAIAPPQSDQIRALLREYADVRLQTSDPDRIETAMARSEEIHKELWARMVETTLVDRGPIASAAAQALTTVIELHHKRATVVFEHRIPPMIWFTLAGVMVFSMLLVGYYMGLVGRRRVTVALPFLLAFCLVLVLIADLDRVDQRALSIDQSAIVEVLEAMR